MAKKIALENRKSKHVKTVKTMKGALREIGKDRSSNKGIVLDEFRRAPKTRKAIDRAGEQIERARTDATESRQPRFAIDRRNIRQWFEQIYGIAKEAIFNEPKYIADSGKRDAWLAKIVRKEPYLLGILQSVVTIDKNRGWTMIGGKIQVRKFVQIAHNFQVAPDLYGWRNGLSVTAQNYYQADLGGVVEIGRSMEDGPLAALYTVDPTQCQLTGMIETPLRYKKGPRGQQYWNPNDYFRVPSFPSTNESLNGLGYCAVSRCIELAKLLVSVFEHDREALGSKAPKGILTIKGIPQDQWLKSLEESTEELKSLEREYYSGVQVLASDNDIEVNLTSLSNLPDQFDHRAFTDMIIYGYALAFGYDPREFWPVSSGALGTATETETQHRKSTSKGGLDFSLGFQEKFQEELPPTIEFEFEQRDVQGDIAEVEFKQAQLNVIQQMYESVNAEQTNMITYDEARELLVEAKLIHEDWTNEEEDEQVTDTDDAGTEALLEKQQVRRAMERFPDQDIVVYNSRTDKTRTIYTPGQRKFKIRNAKLPAPKVRGYGGDYDSVRSAYWDATYTVVRDYLDGSDRSTSFKSAMGRNVVEAFTPAVENGYVDGGGELPLDDDVNDFLTAAQGLELANVDSLFISLKALRDLGEVDAEGEASARADGYAATLDGLYNKAVLFGMGNQMLTFAGTDGEVSCASCQSLQGQRHKASWWLAHDYVPPTGAGLDCAAGGKCEHELQNDDGDPVTV